MFSPKESLQHYTGFNGTEDLLSVVAQFLSDRMTEVRIAIGAIGAYISIQVYLIQLT